ncbi:MAG: SRPBCC family protein [Hyphomicrobiaceae bacterium]|nr:SRPBCC family protein [Hyphomicrobiaceae bacterium]
MLKWLAAALVAILTAFGIYIALQPSQYTITREAHINAPPEAVFAQVNDYHNWQQWSPWAKLDPDAKSTFDGAPSGQGAVFGWAGNSDVGEGKMTITDSKPNERIAMRLEFVKPMPGTSQTVFTFAPDGDGTRMTWTMSGESSFAGRIVCAFVDMDKMVGSMFEKGMANLDALLKSKS